MQEAKKHFAGREHSPMLVGSWHIAGAQRIPLSRVCSAIILPGSKTAWGQLSAEVRGSATIPSLRPVQAGWHATQAAKTDGLATYSERAPAGARSRAPHNRAPFFPSCLSLRVLCPECRSPLFMFGKCIRGSSQKHLQSSYLIATL